MITFKGRNLRGVAAGAALLGTGETYDKWSAQHGR